jgi:acetolactate synthase-1/2/3 large subunit
MTAFDALASEMAGHGPVFGIPGSGASLELLDALERQGTAFHLSHHEAAAAIMAGTMGRLSGRAGLALAIKGPGLANLVPGLAACWFESFPLVALCEALPAGVDWRQRHKGLHHAALVAAISKGRYGLAANGGEGAFSNAAALATAEVPGPVVLELVAGEVAAEPGGFGALAYESVIAAVERAQRPLVIAGSLALRAGWRDALAALDIPVFSTASTKGVIDEERFPAAGVYTGAGLEKSPESSLLPAADLVVGLGLRPQEVLAAKPFACRRCWRHWPGNPGARTWWLRPGTFSTSTWRAPSQPGPWPPSPGVSTRSGRSSTRDISVPLASTPGGRATPGSA